MTRFENVKKMFEEEFNEEERMKFLMLSGIAALRGLGIDIDKKYYPKIDIVFEKKALTKIQIILGHITNSLKGDKNV